MYNVLNPCQVAPGRSRLQRGSRRRGGVGVHPHGAGRDTDAHSLAGRFVKEVHPAFTPSSSVLQIPPHNVPGVDIRVHVVHILAPPRCGPEVVLVLHGLQRLVDGRRLVAAATVDAPEQVGVLGVDDLPILWQCTFLFFTRRTYHLDTKAGHDPADDRGHDDARRRCHSDQ